MSSRIDESWNYVLNRYIAEQEEYLLREGMFDGVKNMAKNAWNKGKNAVQNTDTYKTAKTNMDNYNKEKTQGTGNGNGVNPLAATAINGSMKALRWLNGKDVSKGNYLKGGLFDKSTTDTTHDKNVQAIKKEVQDWVRKILTWGVVAHSLSNNCKPTAFVLDNIHGVKCLQLRNSNDRNKIGNNLSDNSVGKSNGKGTQGFEASHEIGVALLKSSAFKPKAKLPNGYEKSYGWLRDLIGKLLMSTNIDISQYQGFIEEPKNRLNKIDIDINKACYSFKAQDPNNLPKQVNELLNQKLYIVNEAFNNVINFLKNKDSVGLKVNTPKGKIDLTQYFFDLNQFVNWIMQNKQLTIDKFRRKHVKFYQQP